MKRMSDEFNLQGKTLFKKSRKAVNISAEYPRVATGRHDASKTNILLDYLSLEAAYSYTPAKTRERLPN